MVMRHEVLGALREAVRRMEGARPARVPGVVRSGHDALDRLLPAGGMVRGTIVEWLESGVGSGANTLALLAAREACRDGGPLIVIDRKQMFYPLAARGWGMDLENLVLVYPENDGDEIWALDQVLRTPHIAAVLAWPDRLAGHIFRRLQLAVETSGGLGLFVRRETAKSEPSWADIRWQVVPRTSQAGWRLRVELLRVRGGPGRGSVEIDVE
ncbi:MAG: ImuA family protein [Pirellulales bacterium]